MKKSSLFAISLASLVGLVSCGQQPAPAPAPVYTAKQVNAAIAGVYFDGGTDTSWSNDNYSWMIQDYPYQLPEVEEGQNAYVEGVKQLMDSVLAKVSYLRVFTEAFDSSSSEQIQARGSLSTPDSSIVAEFVIFDYYGSMNVLQIQTQPNPYYEGWVSKSLMLEVIDEPDGWELPEPQLPAPDDSSASSAAEEESLEFEFEIDPFDGTFGGKVTLYSFGPDIQASYGAQLAAAGWTLAGTNMYVDFDAQAQDVHVLVNVGAQKSYTKGEQTITYNVITVYSYKNYFAYSKYASGQLPAVTNFITGVLGIFEGSSYEYKAEDFTIKESTNYTSYSYKYYVDSTEALSQVGYSHPELFKKLSQLVLKGLAVRVMLPSDVSYDEGASICQAAFGIGNYDVYIMSYYGPKSETDATLTGKLMFTFYNNN